MKTIESTNGKSQQIITHEELQDLLWLARHGAIVGLGHGNTDEAEDIAHEIGEKILELAPRWAEKAGSKPKNLKGWAYQSALNLGRKRRKAESRNFSLDESSSTEGLLLALDFALPTAEGADVLLDYKEVRESLPQLVELVHDKVLAQIDITDINIIHGFHLDHLSFKQLSRLTGLSLSNTKQRYYRSLVRLQKSLLDALEEWPKGRELFLEALLRPENLPGLFALCRIRDGEGLEALKSAVETTLSRSKLPQGRPARGEYEELAAEQRLQRLVGELITGLKNFDAAMADCHGSENQFHFLLQRRILEILSPKDLNVGERIRLEGLYRQSHLAQTELGD